MQPGTFDHTILDDCRTEGITPPKTHWARKIETPPYLAYPVRPGITFTYLGTRVNRQSRMVMKDGKPSANMFAAGEIMAGNVLGKGYAAGIGMTIGSVFGRVAGREAARNAEELDAARVLGRIRRHASRSISAAAVLMGATLANAAEPIALRDMGSFHVGGRLVEISGKPVKEVTFTPGGVPAKVDPNGTYQVEQMYVQYFLPANEKGAYPLLMWHGGGLTGVTYETTPDGREGWLNYFLRKGWAVYNSDAVERGRAGWAQYPDIFKGEPVFLTTANPFERFRIGDGAGSYDPDPAKRKLMPGSQFPNEGYENFVKQNVPRWTTTDDAIIAAYIAEIDRVGPFHHPVPQPGRQLWFQGGAGAARQGQGADRDRAGRPRRSRQGRRAQEHSDADRLWRLHREGSRAGRKSAPTALPLRTASAGRAAAASMSSTCRKPASRAIRTW